MGRSGWMFIYDLKEHVIMPLKVEKSGPIPAISVTCNFAGKKMDCEIIKPNKEKVKVENVDVFSANKNHDTTITLKDGMLYEQFKERDCYIKSVAGSSKKSIDCDMK